MSNLAIQIRVTKPITLHPEAMVRGVRSLMGEATQILEHQIGQRTPQGVGGTRTGLAASLFSEVVEQGTRITALVGNTKAYAMPVEFGRKTVGPSHAPPYRALLDWVGLRFGISDPKRQVSLAIAISKFIGARSTRATRQTPSGERMFERGYLASEELIRQRSEEMLQTVGVELIR